MCVTILAIQIGSRLAEWKQAERRLGPLNRNFDCVLDF